MTTEQWMTIKHFTYREFVSPDTGEENMDYRMVHFLDIMRQILGFPLVITSGYRTPEYNAKIGGVADSAHLRGLAVDIKCVSSFTRWKIVNFVMNWYNGVEVRRAGIGDTFLHIDIDSSLPNPVMWTY